MVALLRRNWCAIRRYVPPIPEPARTGTVFQRVERFLTEVATAGGPAPTNGAFAAELNYADDAFVTCRTVLERMQAEGLLKIEYDGKHKRRFILVKSGLTTGWTQRTKRNHFHGRD